MEEKFIAACAAARQEAEKIGVRIRPITEIAQARRMLAGHRESDGFALLADRKSVV